MKELRFEYEELEADVSAAQIEKTAQDLERRQYMPALLLEVDDFFHMTREKMLKEYKRVMKLPLDSEELKAVVGLSSPQEVKEKHLTALLNQYNLLCSLRKGEAEAWDTINELYEDD